MRTDAEGGAVPAERGTAPGSNRRFEAFPRALVLGQEVRIAHRRQIVCAAHRPVPSNESEFIIADDAAYTEHAAGGGVYTDDQTATGTSTLSIPAAAWAELTASLR